MKVFTQSKIKRAIIIVIILFALAQLIPRAQQNKNTSEQMQSIEKLQPIPDSVRHLLVAACYDCHSNNTHYPWYSYVQPFAWYLDYHIREGKKELNFDEFLTYKPKRQKNKLESIENQVAEKEMPLSSYTWLHPAARLDHKERALITRWSKELQPIIKQ